MGSLLRVMIQIGNIPWRWKLKSIIKILSYFDHLLKLTKFLSHLIITFIFPKVFILSGQSFISVSGMIRIIPVITYQFGKQLPVPDCTRLLLTGNGRIYIMVALADWYILPILLQSEKLSGSSSGPWCHWLDLEGFDGHAEQGVQPMWLDLSILVYWSNTIRSHSFEFQYSGRMEKFHAVGKQKLYTWILY